MIYRLAYVHHVMHFKRWSWQSAQNFYPTWCIMFQYVQCNFRILCTFNTVWFVHHHHSPLCPKSSIRLHTESTWTISSFTHIPTNRWYVMQIVCVFSCLEEKNPQISLWRSRYFWSWEAPVRWHWKLLMMSTKLMLKPKTRSCSSTFLCVWLVWSGLVFVLDISLWPWEALLALPGLDSSAFTTAFYMTWDVVSVICYIAALQQRYALAASRGTRISWT